MMRTSPDASGTTQIEEKKMSDEKKEVTVDGEKAGETAQLSDKELNTVSGGLGPANPQERIQVSIQVPPPRQPPPSK
jgi:bacteriocin-like protein